METEKCGHDDLADVSNLMDCDNRRTVYICADCGHRWVVRW